MVLQLQPDLEHIQGCDDEARDESCYAACEQDLGAGALEIVSTSRHVKIANECLTSSRKASGTGDIHQS